MLLLGVIVVILVAVAIGLAANYFHGSFQQKDPKEGATVPQVLSATALIAAFLLATVLSGSGSSYSAAQKASKAEADVIDTLYESAAYVDMPFRQKIQAAAVCYARAVVGPEWKELATGKTSPVPSKWTGTRPGALRATLLEMTPKAQAFGLIQSADSQRGALRTERVTQANPTVPTPIVWLMVVLVSLSLAGLAYSIPRAGNKGQLASLSVVVLTFVVSMAMIYNLDRPFSGVLALKPTAMQATADDDGADYADEYKTQLPCDQDGNPTDEGVAAAAPTPSPTTTVATTTTTRAR
jgi:cytochrome bd-type quinol oxidase subunit 2